MRNSPLRTQRESSLSDSREPGYWRRRKLITRIRGVYTLLGLTCAIAGTIVYLNASSSARLTAYIIWGYAALLFVSPLLTSGRALENDLLTITFELDLLEHGDVSSEVRAEKLFKQHQLELKKYYDQTLAHSGKIFHIGALCIGFGFGIVAFTFYLLLKQPTDRFEDKILISVLGSIGGVLANFIGVIYLRMFSEILKSVTDFHNRLVSTHNLYFSNFILSKIRDQSEQDKVIAEIARRLSSATGVN